MREFSSLNTNKYIPSDTMKNLIIKFEVFKIRILLILFFVTNSIWSQCPTVLNNNQIFCDSDLATVGSLMAQDNGGGVVWYNSATGIVPLANFEPLQNGNIYYADNASGSCAERVGVVVTILSAPAGPNFQGFCVTNLEDATVNSLLAIGLGIQWFATPFGGTPLDPQYYLLVHSILQVKPIHNRAVYLRGWQFLLRLALLKLQLARQINQYVLTILIIHPPF